MPATDVRPECECLITIALAAAKHFNECSVRWLVALAVARDPNEATRNAFKASQMGSRFASLIKGS